MKAFSFVLPATTNFYNLWDRMNLITGFKPPDVLIPERCCELVINSDTGTINVSDSNYANSVGTPVILNGSLLFRTNGNSICLKEIWVKGSGQTVSGWFVWI